MRTIQQIPPNVVEVLNPRALHVIDHTQPTEIPADDQMRERLVWVGPDDRGLELEVVAIVEAGYLLVIHVMPRQFRRRRS